MTKNIMTLKVDAYLRKAKQWQDEMQELRRIVLDCGLIEESKWGKPCYTFQDNNVILIAGFKDYCVISFIKGALLKDAKSILIKPGEDTQSARVIRFTGVPEILKLESVLKSYLKESIAVEKAGLKVEFKKITKRTIPEELQVKFKQNPALKKAFTALTPGRQRAYLMHFSAPKQVKTRESRIEKCIPQILKGQGLNDDYIKRKK
jgi:uncharacterized protein YdeI (YjbR/CyaY-like superfamily)